MINENKFISEAKIKNVFSYNRNNNSNQWEVNHVMQ